MSKSGEVGEPGMEWVRGRWRISQVGVASGRGGRFSLGGSNFCGGERAREGISQGVEASRPGRQWIRSRRRLMHCGRESGGRGDRAMEGVIQGEAVSVPGRE